MSVLFHLLVLLINSSQSVNPLNTRCHVVLWLHPHDTTSCLMSTRWSPQNFPMQLWEALRKCNQESLAPSLMSRGIRSHDVVRHIDLLTGDGIQQWQLETVLATQAPFSWWCRSVSSSAFPRKTCIIVACAGGCIPEQPEAVFGGIGPRHVVQIFQPFDGVKSENLSGNLRGMGNISMASHTHQHSVCSGIFQDGRIQGCCGLLQCGHLLSCAYSVDGITKRCIKDCAPGFSAHCPPWMMLSLSVFPTLGT